MEKQKIIAISGKKQSGKSSLRNYIVGVKLVDEKVIKKFNISTNGHLMVPTVRNNVEVMEILDLNQNNHNFIYYAQQRLWPHVKSYSIANYLKYMCIDLFGLEYNQCFGDNDDKNTDTNIRWSDIAFALPPRKVGVIKREGKIDYFLTAREVMEEFGSICRKIDKDCWANKCLSQIKQEKYPFIIIDDVRFPSEIIKLSNDENFDVAFIRLNRKIIESDVESDIALDGFTGFDLVVPDVDINEKNRIVHTFLKDKGWL